MKSNYREALEREGFILNEGSMICPYCEHEQGLDGKAFGSDTEIEDEVQCPGCGKYYDFIGDIQFTFWATTKPLPVERRK